jgi:uncharacterized protein YbaR (Trm112 family)
VRAFSFFGYKVAAMIAPELLEWLVCVTCKSRLVYFPRGESNQDATGFLLCAGCRLRFPVEEVPVLLRDEAQELAPREVDRLVERARALGFEVPRIP